MTDDSLLERASAAFDCQDYPAAVELLLAGIASGSNHWGLVWRLVVAAARLDRGDALAREALNRAMPAQRSALEGLLAEALRNMQGPEITLKKLKHVKTGANAVFLRELAQRFEADVFVETGTFYGDTTALAADIFAAVHSIELSEVLYQKARVRFADRPSVHLYQGDSASVLPELLKGLSGRVMFWLDGHYCGDASACAGETETPILAELAAIRDANLLESVVLIDDIRCFYSGWKFNDHFGAYYGNQYAPTVGYPSVAAIHELVAATYPAPAFAICGDFALGFQRRPGVTLSPVLEACTLSRSYEGDREGAAEVIAAEERISEAAGEERDVLLELPSEYSFQEGLGLTRHYVLWNALVTAVSIDPTEALRGFERARRLGLDHWRVTWYQAQAAAGAGELGLARELCERVLAVAPEFEEARAFLAGFGHPVP